MRTAFKQIREWIDLACDKCDCPQLKDKIRFEFNGRFTRRLADAKSDFRLVKRTGRDWEENGRFRRVWKSGTIRISRVLWVKCPPSEKRNTIIHEACHIIGDHQGYTRVVHGYAWKALMVQCDEEPSRCHSIDLTGVRRKRKKRRVYCGCLYGLLGATQYGRLKNGTRQYTCRQCGQDMRIEP